MLNKIYAEWLLLLWPVKFCGGLLWFWCFLFWCILAEDPLHASATVSNLSSNTPPL